MSTNPWVCTTYRGSVTATFTFRVISGGSSSINLQTQEGLTGFVAYPTVVETGIVESVLKGPTSISNAVYGKPVAACDNALVKGGSASVIDSSAGITLDLSGSLLLTTQIWRSLRLTMEMIFRRVSANWQ